MYKISEGKKRMKYFFKIKIFNVKTVRNDINNVNENDLLLCFIFKIASFSTENVLLSK